MLPKRAPRFFSIFLLCLIFTAIFVPATCAEPENKVLVLQISEAITPASDDIIDNAIVKAENENFEALILSLDTPGGGLTETQTIIEKIGNATVPVIGYPVKAPPDLRWIPGYMRPRSLSVFRTFAQRDWFRSY
jgi:membrane-bound serine protease (ClpP class)